MKYLLVLIIGILTLTGCSNESDEDLFQPSTEESELFISAATSLSGALHDIVEAFERDDPLIDITVNYGGSGNLSQQIQQGAPVDVFLSADQMRMNLLEDQDLILSDTRIDFTENQLVLIGKKNSSLEVHSLEALASLDIDNIAIGYPDSVPAGNYARQTLLTSNVWESILDQFIFAKDVRQAVTYVESGNADIGFVYYSDVQQSTNLEILLDIDDSLHTPISYPAAVMANSTNRKEAEDFVHFLGSETAEEIFETHGFTK